MHVVNDKIISIQNVSKIYPTGVTALKNVSLDIGRGEIFALLGPNGAGKTTLIGTVCGLTNKSSGDIFIDGEEIPKNYRAIRKKIGLVVQELSVDTYETPWNVSCFSRGLFGLPQSKDIIENLLRSLSLWDKKDSIIRELSGGMKRRVMIAKALAHEPTILFLDEPTAGVDVSLRKDMWDMVRSLRDNGTTIILTTHYIEEAEEMADRIGIINHGELILAEEKNTLIKRLGRKKLLIQLKSQIPQIPPELSDYKISLTKEGTELVYISDSSKDSSKVGEVVQCLIEHDIKIKDLHTEESSLEDIFIDLVAQK